MTGLKELAYASGAGRPYFQGWWQLNAKRKNLVVDWNRQNRAFFIHIPKNAGTSIATLLGLQRPADYHAPAIAFRSADRRLYDQSFSFAVVRNPWDRLVSAYHFVSRDSVFADDRRWREAHLAHAKDFRAFVRALNRPLFRGRVLANQLFTPQWHFLTDLSGRLIVNHIVRHEALDDGIRVATERLGLGRQITPHVNASEHSPYRDEYDDEGRALVASIYRRDIELFGFSF